MVTLLNFILDTLKNNENIDYVIFDGVVIKRDSFKIVDKDNQIIKVVADNKELLINLKLIKVIEFSPDKVSILQVL